MIPIFSSGRGCISEAEMSRVFGSGFFVRIVFGGGGRRGVLCDRSTYFGHRFGAERHIVFMTHTQIYTGT